MSAKTYRLRNSDLKPEFVTCQKIAVMTLLLAFVVGCSPHSSSDYRGAQWVRWTEAQRNAFVVAYIDGFRRGIGEACAFAGNTPDAEQPPISEQRSETAEGCRASANKYSNCKESGLEGPICNAYTEVITAFYAQHPEYRNMSVEYLMYYLSDKEHKSANDLYAMAKSGALKTNW